jgi:hypothetical protein
MDFGQTALEQCHGFMVAYVNSQFISTYYKKIVVIFSFITNGAKLLFSVV